MVVASCPLRPQRPLLTWSTSQFVLTTPPRPPPPLVQPQTRRTRSTARTPQRPVSARRCRTTTCPRTEDRRERRSSSTASRPAGAERPGQRRIGEQGQGIGAQPDSLSLLPIHNLLPPHTWSDPMTSQLTSSSTGNGWVPPPLDSGTHGGYGK